MVERDPWKSAELDKRDAQDKMTENFSRPNSSSGAELMASLDKPIEYRAPKHAAEPVLPAANERESAWESTGSRQGFTMPPIEQQRALVNMNAGTPEMKRNVEEADRQAWLAERGITSEEQVILPRTEKKGPHYSRRGGRSYTEISDSEAEQRAADAIPVTPVNLSSEAEAARRLALDQDKAS